MAHDLTFPLTDSAQSEPALVTISLTNDEINEGAEVFMVMLELVDAVDPDRVDLSVRNASLCRNGDNDRKSIHIHATKALHVVHHYSIVGFL